MKDPGFRTLKVSLDCAPGGPGVLYFNADADTAGRGRWIGRKGGFRVWGTTAIRSAYWVCERDGRLVVGRTVNDTDIQIAASDKQSLKPDFNRISAEISDGGIKASLNGAQLINKSGFAPLPGRRAAFMTRPYLKRGKGRIRNFTASDGRCSVAVPFAGRSASRVAGNWRGAAVNGGGFDIADEAGKTVQALKGGGA